ncbi:hypothetical protein D3C84_857100 [compost metagenome]
MQSGIETINALTHHELGASCITHGHDRGHGYRKVNGLSVIDGQQASVVRVDQGHQAPVHGSESCGIDHQGMKQQQCGAQPAKLIANQVDVEHLIGAVAEHASAVQD